MVLNIGLNQTVILNRPCLNRLRSLKWLRLGTVTDCYHCAEHSDFKMSSCWVTYLFDLIAYCNLALFMTNSTFNPTCTDDGSVNE